MVYIETANRPAGLIEGNFTVAGLFPEDFDPESLRTLFGPLPSLDELALGAPKGAARSIGALKAWSPTLQKLVWQRPFGTFWNGGELSTAGGIVVQGDAAGFLNIYDAVSGEILKSLDVGTSLMAAPMTYRVAGKQYIAIMAGYGGGPGLCSPFPPASAAYRYGNEGRIVAFALDEAARCYPQVCSSRPAPVEN
jgi:quinohemoprotein ethanol dehydrogenase